MACKALASINWFVDQEVQNKTRDLGGIDIVRRVRDAHLEHAVVRATCDQVLCCLFTLRSLALQCNLLRSDRLDRHGSAPAPCGSPSSPSSPSVAASKD